MSPLACELELPVGSHIHPVISVQYEHAHSSGDEDVYEVERLVDHRPKKGKIREYLDGPKDDQWKSVKDLRHSRELVDEYLCKMEMEKGLEGKAGGRKGGKVDA